MENTHEKYAELYDSTLRGYIEGLFKKDYMEGFYISALVRNGDKWIVKLEKNL